ncbi:MAG: ATP-binding cassette domain-containing protein [Clostridiales bacterium]
MLELNKIVKIYNIGTANEHQLFDDFNLTVKTGEFASVIGSNGSGKTTMLNIICGTIPMESGDILLDKKSIKKIPDYKRTKRIGRVYQDPGMGTCGDLTILENMALADCKGKSFNLKFGVNKKRIPYYQELLQQLNLGLENNMNTKVGSLSGGQRQAMALLMSTMADLDFLILDEHTAALDPKTAETIMELTNTIVQKKALTTIMVTHNLRHAQTYGSRLIMMDKGEIILDKKDKEKEAVTVEYLLKIFNDISVECGN